MSTVLRHLSAAIVCLFVAFGNGCGRTLVPPECPQCPDGGGWQEVIIPIAGLWSNPNDLTHEPEGGMEVLDNMTSDAPGVWEPRRGFSKLEGTPTLTGPIHQMTFFRGDLIVHHNTNKLSRWTGAAWSTYSGTFTVPARSSSGKVDFETSVQSLFVTTDAGVYELDEPEGAWRLTGTPKGLLPTATLRRTVNETGFATANGQWAYRVEWGYRNANDRLQIGAPSGRALVQNPASLVVAAANISKTAGSAVVTVINTTHGLVTGEYIDVTLGGAEANFAAGTFQVTVLSSTSFSYNDGGSSVFTGNPGNPITYGFTNGRNVSLTIPIPSGITTDYFALVYRTAKSATATSEPNSSLSQVYERSPTNLEIAAGSMTVVDITPDDFRGALIDVAAETELAAKERPPVVVDLAEFHNCMFGAGTRTAQTFEFQLIAVGSPRGIQINDALNFRSPLDFNDANYFEVGIQGAAAESVVAGQFRVYTDGSAAQNIANTARSMVRVLNGKALNTYLYAEYVSSDVDAPGKVRVYAQTPLVGKYSAQISSTNTYAGAAFIPEIPRLLTVNAGQLTRAANVVTVNTVQDHDLALGQQIELVNEDGPAEANFPEGIKTVASVVDPNTFTYNETGANASSTAIHYVFTFPLADSESINIDRTDRLTFSLPDRPWAMPPINERFIDGGGHLTGETGSPEIHKIVANRDRLYIASDVGVFTLSGYYPDFVLSTMQTPLESWAPEALVSTGTPGRVYNFTDQGFVEMVVQARTVSTPIQDVFQALGASEALLNALKSYAFAVAYPSEFKVLLFLPDSSDDTEAKQVYVLHERTGAWSRWDITGTAAAIDPTADKLYVGQADGAVWVERKARTLADYADADGSSITSTVRWGRWFGKEGATFDKEVTSGLVLVKPPPDAGPEFTTLTIASLNDYNPTLSTPETLTLDSAVTSQLPFRQPDHMQRGGFFQWELVHDTVNKRFKLLGLGLNYRKGAAKEGY